MNLHLKVILLVVELMRRARHVHDVILTAVLNVRVDLHREVLDDDTAHMSHQRYVVRAVFRMPEHRLVTGHVIVRPYSVVDAQHLKGHAAMQLGIVGERNGHAFLSVYVRRIVEVRADVEVLPDQLVTNLGINADSECLLQVLIRVSALGWLLVRLP